MPDGTEVLVDPAVSRGKFERELANYRTFEDAMQRRGQWLLRAEFPEVFTVFAAPRGTPPVVVFGALLDYTNYDLWPPSVRLVNPFTRQPYRYAELLTRLPRRDPAAPPPAVPGMPTPVQELMQAFKPEDVPFLCVPGTREYHANPGHSGDDWLLRRADGEGSIYNILDVLWRYGVDPIAGLQMQMTLAPAFDRIPE
ncbi:hypothetical protein GCM10009416_11710 [Craurococcus roseus]|uniref:Metal binding domain-containing protein n=1 Tax=Craurococcus roseus TaxID=77585 RepID=A0ABN1EUD0_9PROT